MTLLKAAARITGGIAVLAAIVFLARRIADSASDLAHAAASFSMATYSLLALAAAAYGLALSGKGLAWGQLLAGSLEQKLPWARVISVHGRSQIYKYLPGNVFHFASRQVRGRQLGWSHVNIAAATTFEVVLNIGAALLVAVALGSWTTLKAGSDVSLGGLALWLSLLFGLATLLAYALPHLPLTQKFPRLSRFFKLARSPALLRALAAYLLFFCAVGLLFGAVLSLFDGPPSISLMATACAAFSFAWIVGFVTPGAPGGLGVREALLILLISPAAGDAAATAAALLYRVVTLAGEFLYFLGASLISRYCLDGDERPVPPAL